MSPRLRLMSPLLLLAWCAPAAPAAEVDYPIAVATAGDGAVYIADRYLPGVWRFQDGKLELYFEGSKKFRTPLNAIRCLAIDRDGRLLAGDSATRQVYRFDEAGKPQPLLKGPVGIGIPMAVATARDGTIFVADLETQRVWKVPAGGGEPAEVAEVPGIRSLAIAEDGSLRVLTNTANAVVRVAPDGKIETILAERTFRYPQHIVLDESGDAVVSDGYARTIWKIDARGKATKWIAGDPLQHPVGIAWSGGDLLITDSKQRTVYRADAEGKVSPLLPPRAPQAP